MIISNFLFKLKTMKDFTYYLLMSMIIIILLSKTYDNYSCTPKPIYSCYIIWDNIITCNWVDDKVDSSLYIFDPKANTKLIVNRIQ